MTTPHPHYRRKIDQGDKGTALAILYGSPIAMRGTRALHTWLDTAGITRARLAAQSIALVVKNTAARASLDATSFFTHSPRAGRATQAAKRGVGAESIEQLGRWRSYVYEHYIRFATIWDDAPAARPGL